MATRIIDGFLIQILDHDICYELETIEPGVSVLAGDFGQEIREQNFKDDIVVSDQKLVVAGEALEDHKDRCPEVILTILKILTLCLH